jgi:hypothetical protein
MSTAELLSRIRGSDDVSFSGQVEAAGMLGLSLTGPLADIVDLPSSTSRLQVWWRDAEYWRVERLEPPGGTDLFHEGGTAISWKEDVQLATHASDGLALRPQEVDMLPPQLAGWALTEVDAEELTRLPTRKVAGVEAAGLRVTPSGLAGSVDRVDMWVDYDTGLPLQVRVWGGDDSVPAVDTHFAEIDFSRPSEQDVAFEPPAGALVLSGGELIQHIPGVYRSVDLAGLPLVAGQATEPITRYGRGVTQLLVIALDDHVADPLRDQLESMPGAEVDRRGTWLSAGPLHLLLSPCVGDTAHWLLAGTVHEATLRMASRDVYAKEWEVTPTRHAC